MQANLKEESGSFQGSKFFPFLFLFPSSEAVIGLYCLSTIYNLNTAIRVRGDADPANTLVIGNRSNAALSINFAYHIRIVERAV